MLTGNTPTTPETSPEQSAGKPSAWQTIGRIALWFSVILWLVVVGGPVVLILTVEGCCGISALMSRGQHVWKIEPGMSQEQVRDLVGDPDFIDSDESWGYHRGCHDPRYVYFDDSGRVSTVY